jgi:putative ABC transport system substrate-binding protein
VRDRLALLASLACLVAPLLVVALAEAQSSERTHRIGVLTMVGGPTPRIEALRKALADLGHEEGRNLAIEWKWAGGSTERLVELAGDLVRAKAEVIVAGGPQPVAAAKRATATIPVVMVGAADPVRAGFVASLARPGGNLTGLSLDVTPELFAKQLQLVKEVLPQVARVAVLWNSGTPGAQPFADALVGAGRALEIRLQWIDVAGRSEFGRAFADMTRERAGAVIVVADPFIYVHRADIVRLAAEHRIPAMYLFDEIVRAGGFMSYDPSLVDLYRWAATYVGRILRGAKPADLPIEQPTKFDVVINMRAARVLGLTMPPALLLRAAEVLE